MIGLSMVLEETAAVADHGVVFHAINLQESAETVSAFVADRSWSLPVLFDTEGVVSKTYGAPPIPLTVLIDRGGVIRRVHTGVSPLTYRAELKQDLADLLSPGDESKKP